MNTKDFFDLFKLNILKNSRIYLLLIVWFVVFAYIPFFVKLLPLFFISYLADIQKNLPQTDYLVIPLRALMFIFWVLSSVLFIELHNRFKNLKKRRSSYNFTSNSWNKDWIYNGRPKLLANPVALRINSSRAGCILKKYVWKNFEMKFKLQFCHPLAENLGIIFRAQDLENYFMVEIIKDGSNKLLVKPHIRYQGMWEYIKEETIINENAPDSFQIILTVKDLEVNLSIDSNNNFNWTLPTHVDINLIESGIREKKIVRENEVEQGFGAPINFLPNIDFRDSYGMIGFRANLVQGADIIGLSIKSI